MEVILPMCLSRRVCCRSDRKLDNVDVNVSCTLDGQEHLDSESTEI